MLSVYVLRLMSFNFRCMTSTFLEQLVATASHLCCCCCLRRRHFFVVNVVGFGVQLLLSKHRCRYCAYCWLVPPRFLRSRAHSYSSKRATAVAEKVCRWLENQRLLLERPLLNYSLLPIVCANPLALPCLCIFTMLGCVLIGSRRCTENFHYP